MPRAGCKRRPARLLFQSQIPLDVECGHAALAGGCDYRRVSTAIPYLQTLGGFLVERVG